jgi:hypothetical protein
VRLPALFAVGATVAATILLATADASAVGTRVFELDSLDKLSGGDVQGVSIGSDGVVRAGWTLGHLALPSDAGTTATCALTLADGAVLVGTGPTSGGKIVRVAHDRATVFADTKENAVNALALGPDGAIYAATTSSRIYRVSEGKAEVYATLPGVDSVFSLAVDPSGGALFAGTGSDGAVVRVAAGGAASLPPATQRESSVYFKTSDPFVVALAIGGDGALYAGTSGKGLLYRITAPGRATVLYDFPGGDVHAIAAGPNGTLYAINNEEPGGPPGEGADLAARGHPTAGRSPGGPSTVSRAKPGKGSLWRFDAQGRPERMMHHDEFHYLSLAVDARGVPFVGTGAEGRVYTVDDSHAVSLVADTTERQIGALGFTGRTWFVMGSDPAAFHRVVSLGGPDSVWTSKPLDAGLQARFGHATWRGTGAVALSTRSGDTPTPDTTWSAWSAPIAQGGITPSPPGRFVQLRARMTDASATIADITLAFVTQNLRAVVTEVGERDRPAPSKDPIPASGGEPPKHDSAVHLAWKVDNPDNDELRYRVQFRQEGQSRWLDAMPRDTVLTKPELDWETAALPEGKYRVRVDASDEIANPPVDATHFALESPPLTVDNTPPVFKTIGVQGRRLRAEVVDGVGPIARVEVAIDGRPEWRPVAPVDGIFDTADETVDVDLTPFLASFEAGPHIVAVRAFDAAGNAVVREVQAP